MKEKVNASPISVTTTKPDIIARAGVGPNAGHSVEFNGENMV